MWLAAFCKPQVMDVLIQYISLDRSRKMTLTSTPKIAFYDTNFPRSLMHHYGKLTKTAVKDRCIIKYDNSVLQLFRVDHKGEDTYDMIYFPFYIALIGNSIHVLNCNCGFRSESQI